MKKTLWNQALRSTAVMLGAIALVTGATMSCDSGLEDRLSALEERVGTIEAELKDQIDVLDKLIKEQKTINSVTFDDEKGVYTILLSDNTTIEVRKADASVPQIGVAKDEKGAYYWTLDGEPMTLPNGDKVYSAPSLRVNSVSGEWEVSADGGATWQSTGIKAGDNASLIKKIDEDETYVYFTLSDGSQLKVAKTAEYRVGILAGKQYFSAGQTRTVRLDLSGVKKLAVYSKPEGWKAVLKGEELSITAPSDQSAEQKGSVIVQVWFNDGTSDISEVAVEIGVADHEIIISSDLKVTITESGRLSGSEEWIGSAVGITKYSEFSETKLIDQLKSDTRVNWVWDFPKETTVKNLCGDIEPEKGEIYVVWCVAYENSYGAAEYTAYYSMVVIPDLKMEVLETTFEDATVAVIPKGISRYYGGVATKVDFDPQYIVDGINDDGEGVLLNGPYNGLLSKYAPQMYTDKNDIRSGQTYVMYVIPYVQGKKYTVQDVMTQEVTIKSITLGGSATVTVSEVETTMQSIKATVTKDAGTYKFYARYFSEEQNKQFALDEMMLEELIKRQPISADSYVVEETGLTAGDKGWIVTMAIDKEGKGKIVRTPANTSELVFSTVALAEPETTVGFNNAVITFPANADIVSYKYIDTERSDWSTNQMWGQADISIDEREANTEKLIAQQTQATFIYNFADAGPDGSLTLEFDGKTTGVPYVCFVVGVDKEGNSTHAVRVDYKPALEKYIAATDAGYKPVGYADILVQDEHKTYEKRSIKEWTVYEFTDRPDEEKPENSWYFGLGTMEITLSPPENCARMWVATVHPDDLELHNNTSDGKDATGYLISDYYTTETTPETLTITKDFFSNAYRIYLIWQDKDGNYYQYTEINPWTLLKDYVPEKPKQ